jgi:hypothetical protein
VATTARTSWCNGERTAGHTASCGRETAGGDNRYGAATAALATATVEPVPARNGRRGFEVTDAALDVFEENDGGAGRRCNVCE